MMAYRKVVEMQEQRTVEAVRYINEGANGGWDANVLKWHERIHAQLTEWTSELMNECTLESMNHWINESLSDRRDEPTNERRNERNERTNEWMSESANQRIITTNQWLSETTNLWIKESANQPMKNQQISEPMNQWISEWANERMKELMDGWIHGWVSYFSLLSFTKRPLRWGTSSPRYFFSEQPFIWATSALNCLSATFSVASATQFFSWRRQHNAFCNVQLQFRKAQE